ncbi:MAG: hypothetical protein HEP70_05145 [Rhodobiaceae bacterium]|nr:hypothetical protein [Rhodobiaceae bacterium]
MRAAAASSVSFKAIDDKVGDWGDFATLSEAELAALFKEMGIGDAQFDRNSIKNMMLAEMAGSGAPPEVLQQLGAQLDGMLGMLQTTIGTSIASYPTDMAREFKQIYAANCCGKAQFIAALGAAETKLANAFRNEFAGNMAGLATQSGAPSAQVAALRGALSGGTTVITYDAGDAAVIAASNMVGNGRGGATNVASNNAPPAPPATNTGGGTQPTTPAPPTPPATNTGGGAQPTTPAPPAPPATNTGGGPTQNPPAPPVANTGGGPTQTPPATPTNQTPGTPPPLPTNSVPATPVVGPPQVPPQQPPVNPGGQMPAQPPGQQPPGLLTLVTPPVDVEPVTLVPGGINTPPPAPLDTSGLLDLTPDPKSPSVEGGGELPDVLDTDRVDATPVDGGPVTMDPGFGNDPVDDLRDEIVAIIGEIERDPGRKPELVGELRDLNTNLQTLVNNNNTTGLTGFWAGDASGTILTAVPYVVDGAKITVIAVVCVGTGGAACAGVAAVDTAFSFVDPAAGVLGNTIANYDSSGNLGGSTVDAFSSQLYEEGSKMIAGKTFTQAIGAATVEGMGAKGEVLVKIVELGGKAIGEFGPALVSGGGGTNNSYDSSASLGSSGSGGSFYSSGSAGEGALIQR